ncbi:MAG: cytidine deaminase [Ruminococcus sp.]|nr:cytidine deaminase [Ruminococcus sp.]MBQ1432127.1 cytidine deaminase [Ruminococcus sp.]
MTNEELLRLAEGAAKNSYCKYSHFSVGAALLAKDGRVFTGCNIENGSYSLTICAERTAIFKAVSEGCTEFSAIAIAGGADGDFTQACYPCGACLQVMSEFCGGSFRVVLTDGEHTLDELMPNRFSL